MKNSIRMLAPVGHNRQMCGFVITAEDGKVILLDGGYTWDAPELLRVLCEVTGEECPHVDAWFLTHPHNDHICAFLEIMEHHPEALRVDRIYYSFPSVQYFSRIEGQLDRDAIETLGHFYRLLPKFADRACVVFGGDRYEVGDVAFDILRTANFKIQDDICNNSSLVVKMTLGGRSARFLGDAGREAGQELLALYGDTDLLKSDICQMAHHGQEGCREELYAAVRPEVCFWCAPDWLWDNDRYGTGFDTDIFETVMTRRWMEGLGVKENLVMKDGLRVYSW